MATGPGAAKVSAQEPKPPESAAEQLVAPLETITDPLGLPNADETATAMVTG
jgi:hypothetical protein